MKKCFECGESATEEHHVIPRVMGGTKTVSLCTKCHMKVHGLDGTKRADNHKENTKRGIDKNRVWELFAVYRTVFIDKVTGIELIKDSLLKEFNHDISIEKTERLYNRLMESDKQYLKILFDQHIDSELSSDWDEEDKTHKFELTVSEVFKNLESFSKLNEEEMKELAEKVGKNIEAEFLKYKKLKTSG